jgi:hypothetical protein
MAKFEYFPPLPQADLPEPEPKFEVKRKTARVPQKFPTISFFFKVPTIRNEVNLPVERFPHGPPGIGIGNYMPKININTE